MYSNPGSLFPGIVQKIYKGASAWHNVFGEKATLCIKEVICTQTVQSTFYTDFAFLRIGDNGGQKECDFKGYSVNVTEICNDINLNLITQNNAQTVNKRSGFLKK